MQSPVFKAQFHGPMRQHGDQGHLTIEDMLSAVFKALLRFIYTDSIHHCMRGLTRVEKIDFTKHLLVAADRYDVEKLKFDCEMPLCKSLRRQTIDFTAPDRLMGNITTAPELPMASTWMTSRCAPQATRGILTFKIKGYSLHKGLGVDRFIRSSEFEVPYATSLMGDMIRKAMSQFSLSFSARMLR
ncbi:hypothetical protein EJB05_08974, partial [Eragrostis curvula]